MKTFNQLVSFLCAEMRICPACGAWPGPCDPLCQQCWQCLLQFKNSRLKNSSIQSEYLFAWVDNEASQLLKILIYFLKYRRHTQAHQKLAQHFMPRHVPPIGAVFVPAPARQARRANHALLWAQALAPHWRGQVVDALKRAESGTQKQLSRQQRRRIRFKCTQNIDPQKYIIFCDDLVTTGSTAQAAWRSMGRPKNFAVWSMAYRPLMGSQSSRTLGNKGEPSSIDVPS